MEGEPKASTYWGSAGGSALATGAEAKPRTDRGQALTAKREPLPIDELVRLCVADSSLFESEFFPRAIRQRSPPMHRRMWEVLEDSSKRQVLLKCFRGSAKTTKLRLYLAKRISYNVTRTVLYVAASEEKAKLSVRWLRNNVERNAKWASAFGLRRGRKWEEMQLEVMHGIDEQPIWVQGIGITGSVRGINFDDFRPDTIVLDDVLDEENSATALQREKHTDLILGAIRESLAPVVDEPNAKLVMLQTPMDMEDATALAEKDPSWHVETFPCWTRDTIDLPIDMQVSSWPERFPTEELRSRKRTMILIQKANIFAREMECRLISAANTAFRPEWVRIRVAPIGLIPCVLAIDPVPPPSEAALAKNLLGKSNEAHAVVGRRGQDYHLLDYRVHTGHEPNWTLATAMELARTWRVQRIVIETVAYQRVLKYMLEQEMQKRGLYYAIVPFQDARQKYMRITGSLSGPLSQSHFWCENSHVEFIHDVSYFPGPAVKPDLLDAISIALSDLSAPVFEMDVTDYEEVEPEEAKLMRDPEGWRGMHSAP